MYITSQIYWVSCAFSIFLWSALSPPLAASHQHSATAEETRHNRLTAGPCLQRPPQVQVWQAQGWLCAVRDHAARWMHSITQHPVQAVAMMVVLCAMPTMAWQIFDPCEQQPVGCIWRTTVETWCRTNTPLSEEHARIIYRTLMRANVLQKIAGYFGMWTPLSQACEGPLL